MTTCEEPVGCAEAEPKFSAISLRVLATDRKLLLKYHPDKSAEAADTDPRFLAIQKAYDVLSDPAKRRE